MLQTRFTELLGLINPIMSAPMSNHSGGQLAAAVSGAGGLGTFGGSNDFGPDWLRQQIALIRSQTDRPFGVGFITQLIEADPVNFEIALEERAPVIVFSFTDPQPWLGRAKDAGAVTICQVQSAELAELAVQAGADVLLAQGNEAGGHTGQMNLLPLLVDLVERYPEAPVLAAGGITSGRALAAVLAAGAQGASLGTALLATPEAAEVPEAFKERIVLSDGQDTAFTRFYDLLGNTPGPKGWPAGCTAIAWCGNGTAGMRISWPTGRSWRRTWRPPVPVKTRKRPQSIWARRRTGGGHPPCGGGGAGDLRRCGGGYSRMGADVRRFATGPVAAHDQPSHHSPVSPSGANSNRRIPRSTCCPGSTTTRRTTPLREAVITNSIFMDSIITTVWFRSTLQANAAHALVPGRVGEGLHPGPYPGRRGPRRGRGQDWRQAPGAGLREDTSREGLPGRRQVGQRGRQGLRGEPGYYQGRQGLRGEPGYYQGRQGLDLHEADRRSQC